MKKALEYLIYASIFVTLLIAILSTATLLILPVILTLIAGDKLMLLLFVITLPVGMIGLAYLISLFYD